MKKILSIVALTAMLAACNSNPKTATDTASSVTAADTSTLNHNAFTDTAREVKLNGVSDTIVGNDGNTYVKVKPKEAEIAPVKKEAPVVVHHTVAHTRRTSTAASPAGSGSTSSNSGTGSTTVAKGDSTQTTTTTTTTTAPAKKKGWSKAATGAAIGAGAGAAAGAIISKKKGAGAIIGGVIGGAGGYIIGRGKDKKDGRY